MGGQAKAISQGDLQRKLETSRKLKALNVSDNKLGSFDGAFFAIDKLKTVDATNCALTKQEV